MKKMPNPVRTLRAVAVSSALIPFAFSPLAAQQTSNAAATTDTSQDQAIVLDPFTVNNSKTIGYSTEETMLGSRTAQNIADIPLSVTLINSEQLSDLHATNSQKAVAFGVPGVTPNTRVSDDYSVRGFRTEFVLQDGVTITQTEEKALYDIDRVEVIRGPIATTLGSNGSDFLGGVINFITRQPTATPQGFVSATGGNYGYMQFTANASGPAYKSDDLEAQYRVTIGATKGKPEKPIETLNEHFIGAGAKVLFGKDKKSEFDFLGSVYQNRNYLYYNDFIDINSYYPGSTLRLNQYSTPSFVAADPSKADWKYGKYVLQGIFKSQLSEHTTLRLLLEETGASDRRMLLRGITISPDNVTLNRQSIPFLTKKYFATGMLDIVNRHDFRYGSNELAVGLEDDDTGSTQWQQVYTMPPIDVRNPDFSKDYLYTVRDYWLPPNGSISQNRANNIAGYAQDSLTLLNDRLILTAGVREVNTRGSNMNYIKNLFLDRSLGRENTHKYGVVVKPVKGVSLYYSEGTDFIPLTGFLYDGSPEKPQIGKDSEWGVKFDYAYNDHVRFYGTVDHFDTALTNVVTTVTVIVNGTPISGNGQVASNTTGGWEAQAGSRLNFGSGHADMVASYYNAVTHQAASILPAQDAVPWAASYMGKYTVDQGPAAGLYFGGGVTGQGKRLELGYSYVETPTLVSLFAGYTFDKSWNLQLNADNLTDKYYIAGIAATGLVETGPRRTIQATLKYSW